MKSSIKLFILVVLSMFICTKASSVISYAQELCAVTSVRASHILVDTKAEADSIKAKINKGEMFEVMASKYSKCPSSVNGGDLGYFERGQMVPEFEKAAFDLPVGEVSNPVKTQFGWHLIKVCDKK